MLIKDIEPIDKWGKNFLNEDDYSAEKLINNLIELPLRKACSIFRKKGIRTLMSSANRNNVLTEREKPIEKQDIYGSGQELSANRPTYEEAGKGYAWIMLDFNTLSNENKDWLFSLEERTSKNEEKIGEKQIWFVQPCEIRSIEYGLKTGKLNYDYLEKTMPENKIPRGIEIDQRLKKFVEKHIVLAYHWRNVSTADCNSKNAN